MTTINVPDTPNVTLVAFYEKKRNDLKSAAFVKLIQSTQDCIDRMLKQYGAKEEFTRYETKQVHATILGCEGGKTSGRVLNKWFLDKRRQERCVDFDKLLDYFRWYSNLPIVVRFCAYAPDTDYSFSSQDLHPYVRSFQIRDDKTAILMGWPYRAGQWPLVLDQFRLGAQKCNALHKFHGSLAAVDNDCYLRVGYFDELPQARVREAIEKYVRAELAASAPVYEIIDHTTLVLAQYQKTTLELATTRAWELDDISAVEMAALYPDATESD